MCVEFVYISDELAGGTYMGGRGGGLRVVCYKLPRDDWLFTHCLQVLQGMLTLHPFN